MDALLKPEIHDLPAKVLTCHLVAGRYPAPDLRNQIKPADGMVTLKTVSRGTLTLMINGEENILFRDQRGYLANLTIANVHQSNGIFQVIDAALLPI